MQSTYCLIAAYFCDTASGIMQLNLKPAVSGDCKYDSLSGPVSLAVRSRIAY